MKGRNRARFEFKAASVNLVLIGARGRGAANFEFFELIASGPSWSPILLGGRKRGGGGGEAGDEWAGCKIKQKSGSERGPGLTRRNLSTFGATSPSPLHPPFRARKIGRSNQENRRGLEAKRL